MRAQGEHVRFIERLGLGPATNSSAVFGLFSVLSMWFDPGARVNVGRGGDSPLHAAVRQDSPHQVSLLLNHGADVNLRDENAQRPVDLARPGDRVQQLLVVFQGTAA